MVTNDVTRPIPSLLPLLVAPETSRLLALEGEYALCPLRLVFHTLEVRLLTCVVASHAGETQKIKVRLNGFHRVNNATIGNLAQTNPF